MNDPTRTLDPATLAHLQSWIGRTETLADDITAAPLRALSATLDRDDALPEPGTVLPPLWHWLYFLPQHRQSELGPDGHARRGGFLPPVPLPRRMWAGGRLQWLPENPLVVGDAVSASRVSSRSTHKAGRTGDLLFVLVKHEVHNAKGLALTRRARHRLPRAPPSPATPAPPPQCPPKKAPAWQREIVPDPVLLFRYSALTFNGHRIHYDRKYVTEVEGYPGLIVHGPLIATQLVDLVRRNAAGALVKRFNFKAVRPTFDLHPLPSPASLEPTARPSSSGRKTMKAGSRCKAPLNSPDPFPISRTPCKTPPTSTRKSATPCAPSAPSSPTNTTARWTKQRGYPEAFVDALTKAGWMAALIPQEYGGSGLGMAEASVIMEEINRGGGNSGACHGQMYVMGTLAAPRHRRSRRKSTCRRSPRGELRLQSMGVTEPTTGTDTTKIKTTAVKKGGRYVINGQKVWISRIQHSDLMILLARTTPLAEVKKSSEGLSIFLVDLQDAIGNGHDRAPDPQHGQPRDQRAVLRQPGDPGGEPDRRGRQGLQVHPRRPERRAHADRGRVHRRRLLVHRPCAQVRQANAWCSAGPSARTRACSSRLPTPTSRSRPPT